MKRSKIIILSALFFLTIAVTAQKVNVFGVYNDEKNPKLSWYNVDNNLKKYPFIVWRASLEDDQYEKINTVSYSYTNKKDSVYYIVLDTTHIQKAIYRYYIQLEDVDEKTTHDSPMVYGHNMGDIPAPRVFNMEIESSETKKAIELTWEVDNNYSIRTQSLFRSDKGLTGYVKIAELGSDATSYTDYVPLSNHSYYYFILLSDFFGYQQPSVHLPGYCSFKQKALPPQKLNLIRKDDEIQLSWSNAETNLSGYKVYRSIGEKEYKPLHIMQTSNDTQLSFSDPLPPESKDDVMIRYYVINYSDSYVESVPSDTVAFYQKAKIKPVAPEEFTAIIYKDFQVKLIWSLAENSHIVGYNVYLSSPERKKLNREIIPSFKNYFVDSKIHLAGNYIYEIEAISDLGEISAIRNIASINMLKPNFHLVVDMIKKKKGVQFVWQAYNSNYVKNILLYRQMADQEPVLVKQFENVATKYIDRDVKKGNSYYYSCVFVLTNEEKVPVKTNLTMHY